MADDQIARFVSDRLHLAASVVHAPALVEQIALGQHRLVGRPAAAFGEALLGALLLGTRLKGRGRLTLSYHGEGLYQHWRIDAYDLGFVRGLVPQRLQAPLAEWNGFDALFRRGTLQVDRQIGEGRPYQSALAVDDLAVRPALNRFLHDSEQTTALLHIAVSVDGQAVEQASGIYCEALPGCAIDELPDAVRHLLDPNATLDLPSAEPAALLAAVLPSADFTELRRYPARFYCPCSRERYQATLRGLPKDQLFQLGDDGTLTTICDFCSAEYVFALDDLV